MQNACISTLSFLSVKPLSVFLRGILPRHIFTILVRSGFCKADSGKKSKKTGETGVKHWSLLNENPSDEGLPGADLDAVQFPFDLGFGRFVDGQFFQAGHFEHRIQTGHFGFLEVEFFHGRE